MNIKCKMVYRLSVPGMPDRDFEDYATVVAFANRAQSRLRNDPATREDARDVTFDQIAVIA